MTQGTLGADWTGSLRARPEFRRHTFVNAGKNGSTSADLRGRVGDDIVRCRPAAVTLLIGTNDVRDGVPLDHYRENVRAIVDDIRARTTARIALMSLPPLGEDLDTGINRRLFGYNAAIKDIAVRSRVDYLPLHERMADKLRRRGGDAKPYDFGFGYAYTAAARHYLLGQSWDQVARSRGLHLLVDHIHLSDRGGEIITALVAEWLSTAAAPPQPASPRRQSEPSATPTTERPLRSGDIV
jgi:lysophospholipase L1-like esterase